MSQKYFSTALRFWKLLKPFHFHIYIGLFFIFILEGWGVVWVWLSGYLITTAGEDNWDKLPYLVCLMFTGEVTSSIVNYLADRNEIKYLDAYLKQHLQEFSLKRILGLTIAQHKDQHSAIKIDVIDQGENAVQLMVGNIFYSFFPTIFFLTIAFVALFAAKPLFGIVALIAFVLLLLWSLHFQKGHYQYIKQNRDNWNEQRKSRQEAFTHFELVKTLGRENYFVRRYMLARAKVIDFSVFTNMRSIKNTTVRMFSQDVLSIGFLCYSLYLYAHGNLALGMVYTIFSLTGRVVSRVGSVERTIREAPQAWAHLEKYLALIDQAPSFNEGGIEPENLNGAIVLDHVFFGYEGHPPVLDDFSVTIEQGKTTAFVGASGSGKTTVGRLLLRAYDYDSGTITVCGKELRTIDANYLRERIGVVEQHVDLFDDTVRENILIGAKEEKRDEVNLRLDEIAEKVRITEFTHRLGDLGYDALVGERGLKLSGGERQRVGIARAIAKDPAIFLFDEATASLDAVNEKYVMDAVYTAAKGKTTIIIAHRLSTVRHADKIVVMERGKVVAEGTHDSLVEHSPHYQELVKHQLEEAI